MLTIAQDTDEVRLACETCGAHMTLPRGEHELLVEHGSRVECEVCGTWQNPPGPPDAA